MFFRISSRKRSTRHPATTSFCARPCVLCRAISRIVSTDSCCALPMKEQVLTTMISASSSCGVNSAPACVSRPIMTSLSTRFFGHPRLTNPTFSRPGTALERTSSWSSTATDVLLTGMQSLYFSIQQQVSIIFAARTGCTTKGSTPRRETGLGHANLDRTYSHRTKAIPEEERCR